MSKYEKRVCRYCGSTFDGRRIVWLGQGDMAQWQALGQRRNRIDKASNYSFWVSILPVFVMGLVGALVGIPSELLKSLVLGMGALYTAGFIWGLRWMSHHIDLLEGQQDKILAAAGYNLEELKHHRHGYVVEEKR